MAGSMYSQFSGATVSMSVTNLLMHEIADFRPFETSLSAKFSCIAIFETAQTWCMPSSCRRYWHYLQDIQSMLPMLFYRNPSSQKYPVCRELGVLLGTSTAPGVVMLAPPQARLLRPDDPGSWRVINHSNLDRNLENGFPETSLHLSFTEYEVPLSVPIGAKDADVIIVEALIFTHDRQSWVADLDIITSLRCDDLFRRLSLPHCKHENDRPRLPMEIPVTQIGRISRKQLVSINSWEELLDPPAGLGASSIGIMQNSDN